MAFNWSERFSTSRHQRKNIFSINSGRKDTVKKCWNYFNKYTCLESIMPLEPFAFFNGFFFKLHKNSADLPLSQVERGWYSQKMLFLSPCMLSEGRNIGLKSGTKTWNSGVVLAFFPRRSPGNLIRWRHDISHQVESSEREENAWVLGWATPDFRIVQIKRESDTQK